MNGLFIQMFEENRYFMLKKKRLLFISLSNAKLLGFKESVKDIALF